MRKKVVFHKSEIQPFVFTRRSRTSFYRSMVQPPTVCVAYTAGVEPPPYGANAYRVRGLHGGSKPPPYGANAYSVRSLHGGSRTLALRVQMRTKCKASYARRHFTLGEARAFQARSAFHEFAPANSFHCDAPHRLAPALQSCGRAPWCKASHARRHITCVAHITFASAYIVCRSKYITCPNGQISRLAMRGISHCARLLARHSLGDTPVCFLKQFEK